MSIRSSARAVQVGGLAALSLGVLLSSWTPPGCEPQSMGPRAANVVVNGSTLGVVFATHPGADVVLFGKIGLGGWEVPETWVSGDAFETEPPLIASDGVDYLTAWSNSGRFDEVRLRPIASDGTAGRELVLDDALGVCRQLLYVDGSYSVFLRNDWGMQYAQVGRDGTELARARLPLRYDGWETDCRAAWSHGRYALLVGTQLDGEGYELHFFLLDRDFELTQHVLLGESDEPFYTHELAWVHDGFAAVYGVQEQRAATMTYFDAQGRMTSSHPFTGKGGFVREVGIATTSPPALVWSESSSHDEERGRIIGALMTEPGVVTDPFWVHKRRNARFVVNASGHGEYFAFGWSRDDRRDGGAVEWSMYRLRQKGDETPHPELFFSVP